jgi:hypothetical protein
MAYLPSLLLTAVDLLLQTLVQHASGFAHYFIGRRFNFCADPWPVPVLPVHVLLQLQVKDPPHGTNTSGPLIWAPDLAAPAKHIRTVFVLELTEHF